MALVRLPLQLSLRDISTTPAILLVSHAPKPVGLVGPVVTAMALLCALGRLHRALWLNHRYRFTTWRWGRIAAALVLVGAVLKLTMLG